MLAVSRCYVAVLTSAHDIPNSRAGKTVTLCLSLIDARALKMLCVAMLLWVGVTFLVGFMCVDSGQSAL